MKNKLFKIFLLMFMFIPGLIFAEFEEAFYENDDVFIIISGSNVKSYEKSSGYTPIDVTDTIKGNDALMEKINKFGTFAFAFNTNLGIPFDLVDYSSYIYVRVPYSESNPEEVGAFSYYNGELIPMEAYYNWTDGDYSYYELYNLYHDGDVIVIKADKTTYKLDDDGSKIEFEDYKLKQYTNNNFVFRNITTDLSESRFKKIAQNHGADYNKFVINNGKDGIIDNIKAYKSDMYKQVPSKYEVLDVYGVFLTNNTFSIPVSLTYTESTYKLSLKLEDKYYNYKDFAIYTVNPNGLVKVTSGKFLEDVYYYFYNSETSDYEYVYTNEYGFRIGDPIPADMDILEWTGVEEYRLASTKTFTYWDIHFNRYFTFNGESYIPIEDAVQNNLISEYGQPVYIRDEYKVTEDSVFTEGKEYYIESENEGERSGISYVDYVVGEDIAKYISNTGRDLYYEGYELVLNSEDLNPENNHLDFTYTVDSANSTIPIFVLAGIKDNSINPKTLDNISLFICLGFISLFGIILIKLFSKRINYEN